MNATANKGIWEEQIASDVKITYNTTVSPERITILKDGANPVHLDYEDGIGEPEVARARAAACEAYHITNPTI